MAYEIFLQLECEDHNGEAPCRVWALNKHFDTFEEAEDTLMHLGLRLNQVTHGRLEQVEGTGHGIDNGW